MASFRLDGKVAIITGGNGGIGLGMAAGLAKAGATVVIAGRNRDKSAAAVQKLEALGGKAAAIEVDIRSEDSCRALVTSTVERFGRLDILVNNAGISYRRQPQDYTLAEWRDVIDTNLTAAFVLCQAAYPHFRNAGGGKIICIGSMMSVFGSPYASAYGASKGGIVQLTKSLACSWAKDNIQANAVLPGWIDTDLTRGSRRDIPGLHDRVVGRTPAGRWGNADDFEGIAVFLASDASNFVNGAAIPVDGAYASAGA